MAEFTNCRIYVSSKNLCEILVERKNKNHCQQSNEVKKANTGHWTKGGGTFHYKNLKELVLLTDSTAIHSIATAASSAVWFWKWNFWGCAKNIVRNASRSPIWYRNTHMWKMWKQQNAETYRWWSRERTARLQTTSSGRRPLLPYLFSH